MVPANEMVPVGAMTSISMRIVSSFSALFIFLWLGHVLREKIMILRRIMLPASLIGGLLALFVIQICSLSKEVSSVIKHDWIVGWSALPGFLNNIVFATLFLGMPIPSVKQIFAIAAPQIAYGWFLAWVCWLIACLLNGLLLMRVWKVNKLFSTLGPIGFTGGHGTAGGLGETYKVLGFQSGGDLALTSATIGILFGVIVGTILVNVSYSCGWTFKSYRDAHPDYEMQGTSPSGNEQLDDENENTAPPLSIEEEQRISKRSSSHDLRPQVALWKFKAIVPTEKRVTAGDITVSGDAIETLALHFCYIASCLIFAYWTKRLLILIEGTSAWLSQYAFFSGFPLFPLCLLWGIVVQMLINRFCEHSPLSRGLIERIGGSALDILVLSAIATTNLSAVATQILPLLILCASILIFQVLAFFFVAPRMLPDFWVERACGEFGVGTATTSIGLMLLRSIDPKLETPAIKAFAAKQLFTEPLLGGGIITSLMLPLMLITSTHHSKC